MSNLNHSPRAEPSPPPYLRKTTSGVANGTRRIAGHDLQTCPCPQNETSRSSEDHSLTDQEPTLAALADERHSFTISCKLQHELLLVLFLLLLGHFLTDYDHLSGL